MNDVVRDITLDHHRKLLALLVEPLKPHGLRKDRWGFWKVLPCGAFAGFVAKPKLARGSKRLEFSAITMGGWPDLYPLFAPLYTLGKPFRSAPQFAQFDHDMLEPRGAAFLAKLWTIWPSTDVPALAHEILPRLLNETIPAVEVMLDRNRLADVLEREVVDGRVYIRARNYALTGQAIEQLRQPQSAYS